MIQTKLYIYFYFAPNFCNVDNNLRSETHWFITDFPKLCWLKYQKEEKMVVFDSIIICLEPDILQFILVVKSIVLRYFTSPVPVCDYSCWSRDLLLRSNWDEQHIWISHRIRIIQLWLSMPGSLNWRHSLRATNIWRKKRWPVTSLPMLSYRKVCDLSSTSFSLIGNLSKSQT